MVREIWMLLIFLLAAPAFGQGYAPSSGGPFAPNPQGDPRSLRAKRESAVSKVGSDEIARSLIETYGEDAVAAVMQCDAATGKRLAEFHNSGDMERQIAKPRELLRAIGQPGAGDEVALFAMQNADKLGDPDCLSAYVSSPLHYTCAIRKLSDGAAEMRARRMQVEAANAPQQQLQLSETQVKMMVGGGFLVLGIAFMWWWKRRQGDYAAA